MCFQYSKSFLHLPLPFFSLLNFGTYFQSCKIFIFFIIKFGSKVQYYKVYSMIVDVFFSFFLFLFFFARKPFQLSRFVLKRNLLFYFNYQEYLKSFVQYFIFDNIFAQKPKKRKKNLNDIFYSSTVTLKYVVLVGLKMHNPLEHIIILKLIKTSFALFHPIIMFIPN